jgi:hypothetical protein
MQDTKNLIGIPSKFDGSILKTLMIKFMCPRRTVKLTHQIHVKYDISSSETKIRLVSNCRFRKNYILHYVWLDEIILFSHCMLRFALNRYVSSFRSSDNQCGQVCAIQITQLYSELYYEMIDSINTYTW